MVEIRIEPPANLLPLIQRVANIPGGLEKAAQRAVRRTLRGGKQDASRKIAQRYTIRAGEVVKTIRLTQSGISGEMSSRGSVIPSRKFLIRPKKRPRRMPTGGVFISNIRGAGGYLRRAFLTHAANIAERVGKSRYPLRFHASPSAPGMLSSPDVGPHIESKLFERLQINLEHELNAVLGGF